MTNLEDIKRKLRSILAKAEDGSGATDAEAQGALEFARRLMLRHQLTESDLGGKDKERTPSEIAADTEYGTVDAFTTGASLSNWEWALVCAINGLVGTTQSYRSHRTEKRNENGNLEFDAKGQPKQAVKIVFYGPAEDCRDARSLFDEWVVVIAALARMKFGGALRGPGRSYAEGFTAGLLNKVNDMKKRETELIGGRSTSGADREYAKLLAGGEDQFTPNNECNALVVAGAREIMLAKHDRGSEWLRKEKGIKLQKSGGGSGGRHHGDAFGAGKRDGKAADFSRTITPKLN